MNDLDNLNNILIPMCLASDDGKAGGASHGPPSIWPLLISALLTIAVWSFVVAVCIRHRGRMSGGVGDGASRCGGRRVGRMQPIKIVK